MFDPDKRIPCVNCKAENVETLVVATALDKQDLPVVKRVCKPCSHEMVEKGEFSYKAQMRYMSICARDLAEQIEKLAGKE